MSLLFSALTILAVAAQPTPAAFETAEKADLGIQAKQFCREEWPGDFSMQEYCLKQQRRGMGEFLDVAERSEKAEYVRAMAKCLDEWTKNDVTDWSMAGYCARQQSEAFDRMR